MASESIYDHPRYYEILFGWDRSKEADFYQHTFARCGAPPGARALEVACGPAQLARILAARGWRVSAFDLRPGMVAWARERAVALRTPIDVFCADMTSFAAREPFAAAFNPLSSFRLLAADADVDAHLARMAAALVPGGVYVLDFALQDDPGAPAITTDESWEMADGDVIVRGENDAVYVDDAGRKLVLAWGDDTHLRGYSAETLTQRVAASGAFEIESWHGEAGRPTGVSEFVLEPSREPPEHGRCMVVLRRDRAR
jgi:SAM-dependent methyltransferase